MKTIAARIGWALLLVAIALFQGFFMNYALDRYTEHACAVKAVRP